MLDKFRSVYECIKEEMTMGRIAKQLIITLMEISY
jgi:hypothetical protein